MNATTTQGTATEYQGTGCTGAQMPFDQINEPGCYVCNWSGHLLRVPPDGIAPGRSPLLNIVGCNQIFVTKICDNPFVPVTKARLLAANWDVAVNF